jgi:ABC-type transporter Mla subunit MlaD
MAKKKDKKSASSSAGRGDAVRSAVEQAFQASAEQAEGARTRAEDIVNDLTQAAGRVRDVLDELRPPTGDDLRSLRESIERLERRVAALESTTAAPEKPAARKPATKKSTAARKSAADKPKSGA